MKKIALILLALVYACIACDGGCSSICTEWEAQPTGEKCVRSQTHCYPVFSKKHVRLRCRTVCAETVPCLRCTKFMKAKEVPERPPAPQGACA